ncbi:hypothetical protein BJV77DRAFT_967098 [Russula vinacea]|nr:hypothetical protein BJV77DRAFT_967098 [Russula vinacea]
MSSHEGPILEDQDQSWTRDRLSSRFACRRQRIWASTFAVGSDCRYEEREHPGDHYSYHWVGVENAAYCIKTQHLLDPFQACLMQVCLQGHLRECMELMVVSEASSLSSGQLAVDDPGPGHLLCPLITLVDQKLPQRESIQSTEVASMSGIFGRLLTSKKPASMEIHIDHRNVTTTVSGADRTQATSDGTSIVPLRVFGKNNSNLGKSRGVASQLKHVHIGVSTDGSATSPKNVSRIRSERYKVKDQIEVDADIWQDKISSQYPIEIERVLSLCKWRAAVCRRWRE